LFVYLVCIEMCFIKDFSQNTSEIFFFAAIGKYLSAHVARFLRAIVILLKQKYCKQIKHIRHKAYTLGT